MYHISKDKRSRKSAELIWKGMEQCLQEKSFDKLRISDINQKSYVSRATFYRLFDSLQDVLAYECDQIYSQLAETVKHADSFSKQDFFVLLVEKWMAQDVLIKVLVENNMTNVIYDTHMKNRDFMKRIFLKDTTVSEWESDYLIALLANIIPAAMDAWYRHGRTESASEVYQAVRRSMDIISAQLSSVTL